MSGAVAQTFRSARPNTGRPEGLGTSWHTTVRVKKSLKSAGRVRLDAIAELTNPVKLPKPEADPVKDFLGARTFRLGLLVGF